MTALRTFQLRMLWTSRTSVSREGVGHGGGLGAALGRHFDSLIEEPIDGRSITPCLHQLVDVRAKVPSEALRQLPSRQPESVNRAVLGGVLVLAVHNLFGG